MRHRGVLPAPGTVLPASRTVLPAVLLVVLLGCGGGNGPDEGGDRGGDQRGDDGGTSGEVAHDLVALLSETAAGGSTDGAAVRLDGRQQALARFTAPLRRGLGAEVRRTVAAAVADGVPDGSALLGAVVAIGCEPPTGVDVVRRPGGLEVRGTGEAGREVQCLAPVTTAALVVVDEDEL